MVYNNYSKPCLGTNNIEFHVVSSSVSSQDTYRLWNCVCATLPIELECHVNQFTGPSGTLSICKIIFRSPIGAFYSRDKTDVSQILCALFLGQLTLNFMKFQQIYLIKTRIISETANITTLLSVFKGEVGWILFCFIKSVEPRHL